MKQRAGTAPPLDTSAEVETPENVRFHHYVAGPARRGLAYLIDSLVRGAILLVLGVAAALGGHSMRDDLRGASTGILLVSLFALEWGYYVFFEAIWNGRSPGKRALGLRVVTDSGQPLHVIDTLLRNLLRAADFLPGAYALGVVVMGRDDRFRRLGDLVAGTMVVVEQRHRVGQPLRIEPAPTPRELGALPHRLPLSGEDLDAIELFLRRADSLSPLRAAELAAIVAPTFARRLGANYTDPQRFLAVLYHRASHAQRGEAQW